jgi:hypothetical protein
MSTNFLQFGGILNIPDAPLNTTIFQEVNYGSSGSTLIPKSSKGEQVTCDGPLSLLGHAQSSPSLSVDFKTSLPENTLKYMSLNTSKGYRQLNNKTWKLSGRWESREEIIPFNKRANHG